MTIPEEHMKVYREAANEMEKQKIFKRKQEDLQWVMETAEERAKYYRKQRSGTHEQIQEADSYIHQYESIRNQAELKLLKLVLEQ